MNTHASEDGAAHDQDLETSLRWIMRNGIGIQFMETLAVGAILTAFALNLGASNLVIGLLAAIPHLSGLAQIPGVWLVDRWRKRRPIYIWAGAVARPMMLVIGACAFLPPGEWALALLMFAFLLRYVAGNILSVAWNSWMRDLVPDNAMGRVFGGRQRLMIAISAAVSLLAAAFIDSWKAFSGLPELYAFSVVYGLSFLGGMYAIWCARRIVEPPLPPADSDDGLFARMREPLQDRNFRRLLKFTASWSFAVNLAAPFFAVMMFQGMGLSITWVQALATLSQLAAFFTVRRWGAVADRFSNRAVLAFCGPVFILCIFAWTFTTNPGMHSLTIPLLIGIHILTGVASAGVGLASGNISLKLAPRGDATAYLATSSVVNSLAAGIAAVAGGLTADFFADREFSLILHWHSPDRDVAMTTMSLTHWDFFFAFATVIGLYSLHRLSFVEESGHVKDRVVVDVLSSMARRGVRNLSTVAGLRAITEFPFELLRRAIRRKKD